MKLARYIVNHPLVVLLLAAVVTVVLVTGVLFVTGEQIEREKIEQLDHVVERYALALNYETVNGKALGAASLLGVAHPGIKLAVLGSLPEDDDRVVRALQMVVKEFQADNAFVMNRDGTIVAYSSRSGADGTGRNFAFRHYFREAMQGESNVYAAVGMNSGRRGLYFAAPVYRANSMASEIIGVVVIKRGLQGIDELLQRWPDPAFLLSPQGIVFASNRPEWLFRARKPLSPQDRKILQQSRQFGNLLDAGDPLLLPVDIGQQTVHLDDREYAVARSSIGWSGPAREWKLVLLQDASGWFPLSRRLTLASGIALLSALAFILLWSFSRNRYRRMLDDEKIRTLNRVVEQSPASIMIMDTEGVVGYVNPRFSEVSGYAREEVTGRHITDLGLLKISQQRYGEMWQQILDGDEWHGEVECARKDGSRYWDMMSVFPIKEEGGRVSSVVVASEDISERKRMEAELRQAKQEAEEANRAKSDFLANMSHEIRTPMNAVIGLTHLALGTELTPRQRDYMEKVHNSAQNLLGIINDILDFSKIEAGKLEMECIPFDLRDVLDNLDQVVGMKAEERGLEFAIECPEDVPVHLQGDPLRLGQVLLNLANNAIKFTHEGSVRVRIGMEQRGDDRVTLRFEVVDTGIGMDDKQRRKLFRAFSQGDSSTSRKYGGTGLGLSICRNLVQMMDGEIGVDSEQGQGSRFWFTAAFGLASAAEAAGAERVPGNGDEAADALLGARLLLVEDNTINQQVALELLERLGVQVTVAEDGRQAVDAVRKEDFDGVLMDIQMPVMDGYEATREIRRDERFRELPVIAMTANAMVSDQQAALEAGMNAHIPKPIDPGELYRTLVRWIRVAHPALPPKDGRAEAGAEGGAGKLPAGLPGIDTEAGLQRVGGNPGLFRKLLGEFYEDHREDVRRIRAALEGGDTETAQRLAHTIKGVAATIGAGRLNGVAKELESAIRESRRERYTDLTEQLQMVMEPVLEGLAGLVTQTPASANPAGEGSKEELRAALGALRQLLEEMDPEAEEQLAAFRRLGGDAMDAGLMGRLAEQIGGFEFDEALETLAAIEERLNDRPPAGQASLQEIARLTDELETLLEEMDPDSEEKLAELSALVAGQVDAGLLRKLAGEVGGFEFEDALVTLAELRSGLAAD